MMNVLAVNNPKKNLDGDTSIMTYRGHCVLQTLVRCHFSPSYTTGQRFIYTGCAAGRVVGKYVSMFIM
jgi:WD repeat-containing protein 23